ncbi:MAG: hypothetical protein AB1938_30860 [Myxococcota bacterium]
MPRPRALRVAWLLALVGGSAFAVEPAADGGAETVAGDEGPEALAMDGSPAVVAADGGVEDDTYPLTRDALDVLFQKREAKAKEPMTVGRVYVTLLPGISTSPSTGVLAALTAQGVFLTGPSETTTQSQVQVVAAFTSLRQLFLAVRSQVYLPRNSVALIGDWRLWDNVERTYGLGSESSLDDVSKLEFGFLRIDETALARIFGHWFLGAGLRVDWFANVKDPLREETGTSPMAEYGVGATGSLSVGPSLAMMYDSRDAQVRPTKGLYAQVAARLYPQALGSTTTWFEFWGEFRGYHRPVASSSRQVLAAWLYLWATAGPVPYLNLPANAWDIRGRSSRGYAAGRFRGPVQLYAEVEYRLGITPDGTVAAVAFFNLTTFTSSRTSGFEAPAPGGGLGGRLLLSKEAGAYLAVDFGLGMQSTGLYFTLGETF